MKLPPLLRLATELLTVRELLLNRFTVVIAIVVVASVSGVAYVDENDDGVVQGQVVTEAGEPVADVEVVLRKIPLQGVVKVETTTTDAQGRFEFTDQGDLLEYNILVNVNNETVHRERHHLYFKGQNQNLEVVVDGDELS